MLRQSCRAPPPDCQCLSVVKGLRKDTMRHPVVLICPFRALRATGFRTGPEWDGNQMRRGHFPLTTPACGRNEGCTVIVS